ncbi:hypothetical protein ACPW7J_09560 [Ihubacter sp. rT4E-8]|uniref:hypothetical protein n=1 Tax=Ihubacter sp. rT4E-8 TaxID=3242369 RepID=UPI003CEDC4B7
MLNKDKYEKEIIEIAINGDRLGVTEGKPVACESIVCENCDLIYDYCKEDIRRWANSEYTETPKITRRERRFCEFVETGYIARDEHGGLFWFSEKPDKSKTFWCNNKERLNLSPLDIWFDFIKWEDYIPWKVEDLLKLEVENEI